MQLPLSALTVPIETANCLETVWTFSHLFGIDIIGDIYYRLTFLNIACFKSLTFAILTNVSSALCYQPKKKEKS